jgi:ubiquinone/menaquinone biosynthesis C-methylase UbiE
MVEYGQALAKEQGVSDRVEFSVMDALRTLEFPTGSFDLINQRLGWSYLRTWEWPNLLQEYQRVTQPGGVIRITETAAFGETSSPALNQLYDIARDAFFHAGHLFSNDPQGITNKLAELLHQQGIQNVQTRPVRIDMGSAMTDTGKEDIKLFLQTALPFLQKWSQVPKNYDQLRQTAQEEMEQSDFTAKWEMVTFWGTNAHRQKKLP